MRTILCAIIALCFAWSASAQVPPDPGLPPVEGPQILCNQWFDPCDIRLTNIGGGAGHVAGQVGGRAWRRDNSLGAYFSMMEFRQIDDTTGYLILGATTGRSGRSREGHYFTPEDRLERMALFPNGMIDFNYDDDPANPAPPHRMSALTITGSGGNALHSIRTVQAIIQGTGASVLCAQNEAIIGGGGGCDNGGLRASKPDSNGWEIVCQQSGRNVVYAICAKK